MTATDTRVVVSAVILRLQTNPGNSKPMQNKLRDKPEYFKVKSVKSMPLSESKLDMPR